MQRGYRLVVKTATVFVSFMKQKNAGTNLGSMEEGEDAGILSLFGPDEPNKVNTNKERTKNKKNKRKNRQQQNCSEERSIKQGDDEVREVVVCCYVVVGDKTIDMFSFV